MRNEIITLGATVTLDGHRFFPDKAGVKVKPLYDIVEVEDTLHGTTEDVVVGKMVEVRFRPAKFSAAALTKLYTHAAVIAARNGGSIVGATDKPCVVRSNDGRKRTLACSYVHQEPAFRCKGGQPILGEVLIRGIIGLNADPSQMDNFYNESAEAWDEAGYDPDEEIVPAFYAQCLEDEEDTSSWTNMLIKKDDELVVTPESNLVEFPSQSLGLTNVTIKGYKVKVTGSFLNISENQVLARAYSDIQIGQRTTSQGRRLRLVATTGDCFIVIPNAVLKADAEFSFDLTETVVSTLNWESKPKVVEGTRQSWLIVSETDPDVV